MSLSAAGWMLALGLAIPAQDAHLDMSDESLQLPAVPERRPRQDDPIEGPVSGIDRFQDESRGAAVERLILDFSRLEASLSLGVAIFSPDFDAEPESCARAAFRIPIPRWSSPESGREDVGVVAQFFATSVERDFDPDLDNMAGHPLFFGLALDYAFVQEEDWLVRGQIGLQYGFLEVARGLENGVALAVGGLISRRLVARLWVTLDPHIAIADSGDRIGFLTAGLMWRF